MTIISRAGICILVAVVAACLALAACDADTPTEPTVDEATQQFNQLMQRPDIDQITAHYEQMYTDLRQQLSAAFPDLGAWSQELGTMSAACGDPFAAIDVHREQDDAEVRGMGNWGTSKPLPDAQWNRALAIASGIMQRYGFNPQAEIMNNKPGAHDVNFYDQYGAQFTFGSGNALGFTLETGCHLTAEAKKRGSLSPTITY